MKISVITICYNDKEDLEKTINSVLSQSYKNIEFIIIDGGSSDGTAELVSKYQKNNSIIFKSEPDRGIYDAMNKGIKISSGKWLNFMNAGDFFYDHDVIKNSVPFLQDRYNIVYGDTEIRYKDFNIIKKEPAPNKLWMGRTPHQSAFINSDIMKKYYYNDENRLVADFEFFLTVYYLDGKIKKIDKIVSSFSKDGITEIFDKQVIIDAKKTVKKFINTPKVNAYYSLLLLKPIIKKILPRKIFKFIKEIS